MEKVEDDHSTDKAGDEQNTEKFGDEQSTEKVGDVQSTEKVGDVQSTEKDGDEQSTEKLGDEQTTEKVGDEQSTEKVGDEQSMEKVGDEQSTEKVGDEQSMEKVGESSNTEQIKSSNTGQSSEKAEDEQSTEKVGDDHNSSRENAEDPHLFVDSDSVNVSRNSTNGLLTEVSLSHNTAEKSCSDETVIGDSECSKITLALVDTEKDRIAQPGQPSQESSARVDNPTAVSNVEADDDGSDSGEIITLTQEECGMTDFVISNVCTITKNDKAANDDSSSSDQQLKPNTGSGESKVPDFQGTDQRQNADERTGQQVSSTDDHRIHNDEMEVIDGTQQPANCAVASPPQELCLGSTNENETSLSMQSSSDLEPRSGNKISTLSGQSKPADEPASLTIKFEADDDGYETGPAGSGKKRPQENDKQPTDNREQKRQRVAHTVASSVVERSSHQNSEERGRETEQQSDSNTAEIRISNVVSLSTLQEQSNEIVANTEARRRQRSSNASTSGTALIPSSQSLQAQMIKSMTLPTSSVVLNLPSTLARKSPVGQQPGSTAGVITPGSDKQLKEQLVTHLRHVADKPGSHQFLNIPMPDGSTQSVKVVFTPSLVQQTSAQSLATTSVRQTLAVSAPSSSVNRMPVTTVSGQFFPIAFVHQNQTTSALVSSVAAGQQSVAEPSVAVSSATSVRPLRLIVPNMPTVEPSTTSSADSNGRQDMRKGQASPEAKLSASDMAALIQGKNLVPSLDPPRKRPGASGDQQNQAYRCVECSTMCCTMVGYKFHVKRMSMVVRYACMSCKMPLVFFNKCTFLSHLRKHATHPTGGQVLNLKSYTMSVSSLPSELLPPAALQHMEPLVVDMKEDVSCSECGEVLADIPALALHFGYHMKGCNFDLSCAHCKMIMPTPCSLKAHLRLHDEKFHTLCARPRFVCPECGLWFANQVSLYQHMFATCLHFSRNPQLICPICHNAYLTVDMLMVHLAELHPNPKRLMCSSCRRTYITLAAFKHHIVPIHNTTDYGRYLSSYTLKPACGVCKSDWLTGKAHAELHTKEAMAKAHCVFVCPFCNKGALFVAASRSELKEHLVVRHNAYRFTCTLCKEGFVTLLLLRHHVASIHTRRGRIPCQGCSVAVDNPEALLPHVMWHVTKYVNGGEAPRTCLISQANMEIEAPDKITNDVNSTLFCCRACGAVFDCRFELAKHIHQESHSFTKRKVCPFCQRFDFLTEDRFIIHRGTCMLASGLESSQSKAAADLMKSLGVGSMVRVGVQSSTNPEGTRPSRKPELVPSAPRISIDKSRGSMASQLSLSSSTALVNLAKTASTAGTSSVSLLSSAVVVTASAAASAAASLSSSRSLLAAVTTSAVTTTAITSLSQAVPVMITLKKPGENQCFPAKTNVVMLMPKQQKDLPKVPSQNSIVLKSSTGETMCYIPAASVHSRQPAYTLSGSTAKTVCPSKTAYTLKSAVVSAPKLHLTTDPYKAARVVDLAQRGSKQRPLVVSEVAADDEDDSDATIIDEDAEELMASLSEDKRAPEPPKKLFHPCMLCGLTYNTPELLSAHHASAHSGQKNVLCCQLCLKKGKSVSMTRGSLQKHLTRKHNVAKPVAEQMCREGCTASPAQSEVSTMSASASESSSGSNLDTSSSAAKDPMPVKRLRHVTGDDDYDCAKCHFTSASREEFKIHIVQEHAEENAAQCLECGLCFSALSSLKKHLFLVHKVKNAAAYVEENGIAVAELSEDVAAHMNALTPLGEQEVVIRTAGAYHDSLHSKPLPSQKSVDSSDGEPAEKRKRKNGEGGELECTVCYKAFDSDTALKAHMRNHGMAFIRSRRADSRQQVSLNDSTKSGEEKGE